MSIFTKLFRVSTLSAFQPMSGNNIKTEAERRRFSNSVPGQTGSRIGIMR